MRKRKEANKHKAFALDSCGNGAAIWGLRMENLDLKILSARCHSQFQFRYDVELRDMHGPSQFIKG